MTNNKLIEAGKIVNTHGRSGEVKLQPWADSPDFLAGFERFYIDGAPVKVLSARVHKNCVIAYLDGVTDIDAAIRMKNKIISVSKDDVNLEEGRYFVADLIGLRALDADTGEELGTITDVLALPSNDVYVIERKRDSDVSRGRELLIPAVPEFIVETNLEAGSVKLRMIEGM